MEVPGGVFPCSDSCCPGQFADCLIITSLIMIHERIVCIILRSHTALSSATFGPWGFRFIFCVVTMFGVLVIF